jgi:hypothetical protein
MMGNIHIPYVRAKKNLTNKWNWFLLSSIMLKRLSLFFVCLLLLSFLGEAFHHHDDCADHPDCSICVAVHHKADAGFTFAPSEIQRELTGTVYARPLLAIIAKTTYSPTNTRAPPA